MPRLMVRRGAWKQVPRFLSCFFGAEPPLIGRLSQGDRSVAKKIKKGVIHGGAIALALIGLMMFAGECRALPYRPAAAFSVASEYAPINNSAPPHTQVWNIVPFVGPDGAATLRFFLEAASKPEMVCELRLPASGSAGEIRWEGIGKTKKSVTGILLAPGFPAPCDVLPVGRRDSEDRVYEEMTEAGGRAFSRSYRVSFHESGIEEARAKGWIRGELPGTPALVMVEVTDNNGRPVVKQLWPVGGSWWFYEETPRRRSWLIY